MSAKLDAMPSMIDRIRHDLVGLKMPRALEALDHIVRRLEHGELSALEAIDILLSEELTLRENRRIKTALRMGRLATIQTLAGQMPDLNGYYCVTANDIARERRAKLRKLARFAHVRQSVIERIMHGWSPQQIAFMDALSLSDGLANITLAHCDAVWRGHPLHQLSAQINNRLLDARDQCVPLRGKIRRRLAIGFLGHAGNERLCNRGVEMKDAEIVPPAIETVHIAFAEGGKAALARTEVEKHGRPHRGPAQARPGPHRLIEVLDAGDAGFHEMDGFAPNCRLETICYVAGHLAGDADRNLAHRFVEALGRLHDPIRSSLVPHNFDQRD